MWLIIATHVTTKVYTFFYDKRKCKIKRVMYSFSNRVLEYTRQTHKINIIKVHSKNENVKFQYKLDWSILP